MMDRGGMRMSAHQQHMMMMEEEAETSSRYQVTLFESLLSFVVSRYLDKGCNRIETKK